MHRTMSRATSNNTSTTAGTTILARPQAQRRKARSPAPIRSKRKHRLRRSRVLSDRLQLQRRSLPTLQARHRAEPPVAQLPARLVLPRRLAHQVHLPQELSLGAPREDQLPQAALLQEHRAAVLPQPHRQVAPVITLGALQARPSPVKPHLQSRLSLARAVAAPAAVEEAEVAEVAEEVVAVEAPLPLPPVLPPARAP